MRATRGKSERPAARRWTLLIVPHDSDPTRSLSVSERGIRSVVSAAAAALVVGAVAVTVVAVQLAAPAAFGPGRENRRLARDVALMRARLDSLEDTLDVIGRRDRRIRLLAGLPANGPLDSLGPPLASADDRLTPLGLPHAPERGARGDDLVSGRHPSRGAEAGWLLRRANAIAASLTEITDTLAGTAERSTRVPSIMPTAGWLSSHFSHSRFHPILHTSRPHEGIDVAAPMGSPIVAPAIGRVARVERDPGYGLVVEIDHGDGIATRFAHCSRVLVKAGDQVARGQTIAAVGTSGLSTAPHLHYEIHINGRAVDPLTYVLPGGRPE